MNHDDGIITRIIIEEIWKIYPYVLIDPDNELAFYLLKIVQDADDKTPFKITEYFLVDVKKTKRVSYKLG